MANLTVSAVNSSYVVTHKNAYAVFFASKADAVYYILEGYYEKGKIEATVADAINLAIEGGKAYDGWKLRFQPKTLTISGGPDGVLVSNLFDANKPDGGELVTIEGVSAKYFANNPGYFEGSKVKFTVKYAK